MTWRRGRRGGQKARTQQQGGRSQHTGDGDSGNTATQKKQGNGANEARHQRAWDCGGADGAKAPPLAADEAERRDDGGAARGWQRGTAESPHSAIMYAAMMAAVAQLGQEGLPETPGGGLSPMELLGLTDLTQLAGLEPAP